MKNPLNIWQFGRDIFTAVHLTCTWKLFMLLYKTSQLRGGSVLASTPAVQVHIDRMDEGNQAEHCQANINLNVEGGKACDNKNNGQNKCSSTLFS